MLKLLRARKIRKTAHETLRHGRHLLHMRGDIMSAAEVERLSASLDALRSVLKKGAAAEVETAANALYDVVCKLTPQRRFPSLRENVEVIVVAIAVAMGFRTYYLQPFKIPTGSMEPTLYGIHSHDGNGPGILDRVPLKFAKWLVTGQMYHQIRVKGGGRLSAPESAGPLHPASLVCRVGRKPYRLPRHAKPNFYPGQYVKDGSVLWEGTITAGDHVFVNKVAWNFRRPRRGEIMVFDTEGIPGIQQGTHYIKRLSALPGESVAINPPHLVINGSPVTEPEPMRRIADGSPGYAGYTLAPGSTILGHPSDSFQLSDTEFFALGDNTLNSRDGRYWGAVPQANMVGPAVFIYWPVSRRWGLAR